MFDESFENEEQQVPWREYFSIIYRGRWWIMITLLLVFSAVTYYTLQMPPVYQAETTMEIRRDANMFRDQMSMFSSSDDRNISNHMQLIKSRAVAKMVLDDVDSYENAEYIKVSKIASKGISYNSRINMLRGMISVSPIKNTDIVRIVINSDSPLETAYLANTVAKQYVVYSSKANQGEVGAIADFLEEQLDLIKVKLEESEINLQKYKSSAGFVSLSDETKTIINEVSRFEAKYNTAIASLQAIGKRIEYLKEQIGDKKAQIVDYIAKDTSPIIEGYNRNISVLYSKIAEMEMSRKPGAKKLIKRYEKQIEKYKQEIRKQANVLASSKGAGSNPLQENRELIKSILDASSEQQAIKAEAKALKSIVVKYNSQMDDIPQKSLELARLSRENMINEETYIMMQNKYEEYRISQAGQVGNARIVDEAIAPSSPIKPNKPLYIVIGFIAGLVLGVIMAFIFAFFDSSIKTIEEVEKFNIPFLGAIPTINLAEIEKKMGKTSKDLNEFERHKIESRLITHFSPKSPISEAYRAIRTNIQFSKVDNPPKVILVSSSIPKEGKSTTASNLAVTISQSGDRVLLIDADMRRPVVHKNFNLLREIGISDYLIKNTPLEDIVKRTDIENLSIITCGTIPPNPSELLGSKKMEKFIAEVREKFDFVIFDTPPIITVTDATVLSRKVDGTIVVVSSGKVGKAEVGRSVGLIQSVESNLIGLILNNMDIKKLYGNYYYYYHYYHYYYYYGSEKRKRRKKAKHKRTIPNEV